MKNVIDSRFLAATIPALACTLALTACGSGSDDKGGDGNSGNGDTSIAITRRTVTRNVTPAQGPVTKSVLIKVTRPPANGLWVEGTYSTNAIDSLDVSGGSSEQINVEFTFRRPTEQPVGIYTDSINLKVCYTQGCASQVRGSPVTLTITQIVSEPSSVLIDVTDFEVTGKTSETKGPTATAMITTANPPPGGLWSVVQREYPDNPSGGLSGVTGIRKSRTLNRLEIGFQRPDYLTRGVYEDTFKVNVCYDGNCTRPMAGSPFTLHTRYIVKHDVLPEPDIPALPLANRARLAHDVIDAQYSAALEAVVMASTSPRNALYIYDVTSSQEKELQLSAPPLSLSIDPGGLSAAVGHDSRLTYVDLTTVGQLGAPAPTMLDIPVKAQGLVVDGRGYVHVMPPTEQGFFTHSVEIATNTNVPVATAFYIGPQGRLHPSDPFIYTVGAGGPTGTMISKFDISSGAMSWLYSAEDNDSCGNIWLNEAGSTLYTQCGTAYDTSPIQNQDLVNERQLQMSTSQYGAFQAIALSESAQAGEIALLEEDNHALACGYPFEAAHCHTHVALYQSSSLTRTAFYSLDPVPIDDEAFVQRGLFIFHNADGSHEYVISRIEGPEENERRFYLSTLQ